MITDKLQALAASIVCFQFHISFLIGTSLIVYLTFFTPYWYVPVLYYIWACYIDKDTPSLDGRSSEWISSLPMFKYARNYFPIKLHFVAGFELDPKRNYLSCTFPHGFLPLSPVIAFMSKCFDIHKKYPNHKVHGAALNIIFMVPILREFALALGFCRASSEAMGYHLGHPGGGRVVGLAVGGSSEMFYCHNGQYRLTLKSRKGYAKLALSHGAPIVPIFVFGETSILRQKVFAEGSMPRRFMEYSKKLLGYPFVLVYGRGLFQDKFGAIPLKHPINIVVGLPIEVAKVQSPSQEEIERLHEIFKHKLTELFDEYKNQFEEDPTNCKLVIA